MIKKDQDYEEIEIIWHDRKRNFLGLPWSATKYELTKEKIYVRNGNIREVEMNLNKIVYFGVKRSFWQKLFGMGTITIGTSDRYIPFFELKNIKNPFATKDLISLLWNNSIAKK